MSIKSSSLLPSHTFHHIGIMVLFMSILMGFCGFGLVAVSSIIKGWTSEIEHTLSIEIPSFDTKTQTIIETEDIEKHTKSIMRYLQNDPVLTNIDVQKPQKTTNIDDRFDIPRPAFITLSLHPKRAKNSEDRLISNIQNIAPIARIKTPTEWADEIQSTSNTLRFVFLGLACSILFVTTFVITGVVRTQLKASIDTINLIHLMGASPDVIASLFQKAILRPVFLGCFIGLIGLGFIISPLVLFLEYQGSLLLFWGILPIVFTTFLFLSLCVTGLTVSYALRDMP